MFNWLRIPPPLHPDHPICVRLREGGAVSRITPTSRHKYPRKIGKFHLVGLFEATIADCLDPELVLALQVYQDNNPRWDAPVLYEIRFGVMHADKPSTRHALFGTMHKTVQPFRAELFLNVFEGFILPTVFSTRLIYLAKQKARHVPLVPASLGATLAGSPAPETNCPDGTAP